MDGVVVVRCADAPSAMLSLKGFSSTCRRRHCCSVRPQGSDYIIRVKEMTVTTLLPDQIREIALCDRSLG
jgi:hypothetical protein